MLARILLLLALLGAPIYALSQSSGTDTPSSTAQPMKEVMQAQFGPGYKLDPKFTPLVGDFDGDKQEDLALVAKGTDPLGNSARYDYKVADPYDAYFGFGDPKVTARFSNFGDGSAKCILIIHDWKAAKPKAKFVIVNFSFERLALRENTFKKKSVTGIYGQELGGLTGVIFWDGRKYRWEPVEFQDRMDMEGMK